MSQRLYDALQGVLPHVQVDSLTAEEALEEAREAMAEHYRVQSQPVSDVRWVPVDKVEPNDYNPNTVASVEMGLLYHSIFHDGYTQPVVTVYDQERDRYIIVDGFHRYFTMKRNEDIAERTGGLLPVVVIHKPLADRMASTVRHNRARGKHTVAGMSSMVFALLDQGWKDEDVCNHLGMTPEELLRLKHVTGFSRLFADQEYRRAWVTRSQIRIAQAHRGQEGQRAGDPS